MARTLCIVTGASRGLGAALAAQAAGDADATVIGMARGGQDAAASAARAGGSAFEAWTVDLADAAPVAARLEAWLAAQPADAFGRACLINNAAVLTRIGALETCTSAELAQALRVGLEASVLMTSAFLRATSAWPGSRRVLNISSGLGRRAMAGQAPYCAVKAGLDHFSRAVALDQAGRPNGARVVSLAPGVIDTDMQVQLRNAGDEGFPDRGRFLAMKSEGQLATPDDTAARILAFLERPDFGAEPIADIRDA